MNVAGFLLIFPAIALLITWRAVRLWKGRVALYADANPLKPSRSGTFLVVRRYSASVPSLAITAWLFVPTALISHFSEADKSGTLTDVLKVAQWPFWTLTIVFALIALSIQVQGVPMSLVPPNIRHGKSLEL